MGEQEKSSDVIRRERDGLMFRVPRGTEPPRGYSRIINAHDQSGALRVELLSLPYWNPADKIGRAEAVAEAVRACEDAADGPPRTIGDQMRETGLSAASLQESCGFVSCQHYGLRHTGEETERGRACTAPGCKCSGFVVLGECAKGHKLEDCTCGTEYVDPYLPDYELVIGEGEVRPDKHAVHIPVTLKVIQKSMGKLTREALDAIRLHNACRILGISPADLSHAGLAKFVTELYDESSKTDLGDSACALPPPLPDQPKRLTKEGLLGYFEQFLGGARGEASAEVLADLCLLVQSETEARLSAGGGREQITPEDFAEHVVGDLARRGLACCDDETACPKNEEACRVIAMHYDLARGCRYQDAPEASDPGERAAEVIEQLIKNKSLNWMADPDRNSGDDVAVFRRADLVDGVARALGTVARQERVGSGALSERVSFTEAERWMEVHAEFVRYEGRDSRGGLWTIVTTARGEFVTFDQPYKERCEAGVSSYYSPAPGCYSAVCYFIPSAVMLPGAPKVAGSSAPAAGSGAPSPQGSAFFYDQQATVQFDWPTPIGFVAVANVAAVIRAESNSRGFHVEVCHFALESGGHFSLMPVSKQCTHRRQEGEPAAVQQLSGRFSEQSMIDLKVEAANEVAAALDKFWEGRMRTHEHKLIALHFERARKRVLNLDPDRFALMEGE